MARIIKGTCIPMTRFFCPQIKTAAIYPKDPMDKPDRYGDWVLLGTKEGPAGSALGIDEELLAAAREAWPHVLVCRL